MIDKTNPAGRLFEILSEAKKQNIHDKVKDVWSNVLDIENDEVIVTESVVELYYLTKEIQKLIKMNDNINHELYLTSFSAIEKSFFPLNLHTSWGSNSQHLTDESLTRLQFCAEALSMSYSEDSISEEDINDIILKADELFDSIFDSSLDDELRLILLEEIEKIRYSIKVYKIKGAKGIKESLQSVLGAMLVNQNKLRESAINKNEDVLERLTILLEKIDSFISKALRIKKLVSSPISYLIEKISNKDEIVEVID